MEFYNCVMGRRSIRRFKTTQVDNAVIERIVSVAAYAPSWKNTQTTRYIAIKDNERKTELANSCVMDFEWNRKSILSAPALILVTTITGRSGYERDGSFSTSKSEHWESFDAGIATQTLCLAAYDQGLGSVVLGIFDEQKVIETVSVPEGQRLSAIVALGYPDETPQMPARKPVDALLTIIE